MGKVKDLLMSIEEANAELAFLADEVREAQIEEMFNALVAKAEAEEELRRRKLYGDFLEEEAMNNELLRQQEMLSHAADLEDFSPFDTVNS